MTDTLSFVIDTSVAIKWILDEEGSDEADLLRNANMVAPALLRIEAGNVLRTIAARQDVSAKDAIELFSLLQPTLFTGLILGAFSVGLRAV